MLITHVKNDVYLFESDDTYKKDAFIKLYTSNLPRNYIIDLIKTGQLYLKNNFNPLNYIKYENNKYSLKEIDNYQPMFQFAYLFDEDDNIKYPIILLISEIDNKNKLDLLEDFMDCLTIENKDFKLIKNENINIIFQYIEKYLSEDVYYEEN